MSTILMEERQTVWTRSTLLQTIRINLDPGPVEDDEVTPRILRQDSRHYYLPLTTEIRVRRFENRQGSRFKRTVVMAIDNRMEVAGLVSYSRDLVGFNTQKLSRGQLWVMLLYALPGATSRPVVDEHSARLLEDVARLKGKTDYAVVDNVVLRHGEKTRLVPRALVAMRGSGTVPRELDKEYDLSSVCGEASFERFVDYLFKGQLVDLAPHLKDLLNIAKEMGLDRLRDNLVVYGPSLPEKSEIVGKVSWAQHLNAIDTKANSEIRMATEMNVEYELFLCHTQRFVSQSVVEGKRKSRHGVVFKSAGDKTKKTHCVLEVRGVDGKIVLELKQKDWRERRLTVLLWMFVLTSPGSQPHPEALRNANFRHSTKKDGRSSLGTIVVNPSTSPSTAGYTMQVSICIRRRQDCKTGEAIQYNLENDDKLLEDLDRSFGNPYLATARLGPPGGIEVRVPDFILLARTDLGKMVARYAQKDEDDGKKAPFRIEGNGIACTEASMKTLQKYLVGGRIGAGFRVGEVWMAADYLNLDLLKKALEMYYIKDNLESTPVYYPWFSQDVGCKLRGIFKDRIRQEKMVSSVLSTDNAQTEAQIP